MKFTSMNGLGIDPGSVVSAAATLFGGKSGGSKPAGSGGTSISPAFQQSFTPQFSPAMQQQQDSAGASQSANPVQYATGGQYAVPGGGEGSAPYVGAPASPLYPTAQPSIQSSDNYSTLIKYGIIAAIIVVALPMLRETKTGKRAENYTRKKLSKVRRKNRQ